MSDREQQVEAVLERLGIIRPEESSYREIAQAAVDALAAVPSDPERRERAIEAVRRVIPSCSRKYAIRAVDACERELGRAAVPSEVTDEQVERESKALYRRLQTFWWRDRSWEDAGGGMQDAIRVAVRAALEAAR